MESGANTRPFNAGKKFAPHGPLRGYGVDGMRGDKDVRANGTSHANVHVLHGPSGRIACVADIRGNVRLLNQIAQETKAKAIVHTGDFGFYTRDSLARMSDRALRHVVQYSPLLSPKLRSLLLDTDSSNGNALRQGLVGNAEAALSEFPELVSGAIALRVPVFTVWGACEDVHVVERLRTGEYTVPNLHMLDEATTHAIEVGGVRVRLLGLGGAVVLHKLFDNGSGQGTIAGGQGAMWTTMLQLGELVETAQQVYDPSEVRILVTHASPGRDALLAQAALALRADYSLSAGLHLRYVSSYNAFGVHGSLDVFREKLTKARAEFEEVWDAVKGQVESAIDPAQRHLLNHALSVALRLPQPFSAGGRDESAWKNAWFFNLPDAPLGSLVLDISNSRIATETRSQGTSFASRSTKPLAAPPKTNVVLPRAPDASDHVLFLGHMGDAFPVSEEDVKAYFGEFAKDMTHVQFFPAERTRRGDKDETRLRTFVHVAFSTPAAAQAALGARGRTIKDTSVVPTLEPLARRAGERKERKERPKPEAKDEEPAPRPRGTRSRGGRGARSAAARKEAQALKKSDEKPPQAAPNGVDTKAPSEAPKPRSD